MAWFSLSSFLGFGCSLESEDGDTCIVVSSCDHQIPETASLRFQLSPGFSDIEVRKGDSFELGQLVYKGKDGGDLELPLGNYTARARYLKGNDTLFAFDGGTLDYSQSTECDQECYSPDDATLDLAYSPGAW